MLILILFIMIINLAIDLMPYIITAEYIKQQVDITNKALEKENAEKIINNQSE